MRSLDSKLGFCRLALALLALFVAFSGSRAAGAYQQPNAGASQASQYLARAQQLSRKGDYAGAAKAYEQFIRIDPRSFSALNNLGVVYARLGKYTQAAEIYERALRLQPKSFPTLVNLGLCYFKSGDFKNATRPLSQAVELDPNNFQARTLLAMSYFSTKDYEPASREFEKLVAVKPDNSTLQYLLAQSYLESEQEERLLNFFQKILEHSPNSVVVHMLMGEAYDGLDRTTQAIREFKAAEALSPDQPNVHFGLGYLYWKNHDYVNAEPEFRREIAAGGSVAKSEAYLGDIALKKGDKAKARALIEQSLRLYPDTRIACYDLGILDADEKNYGEAIREFENAIQLDPSRADAHYRLAMVYRAEGKPELAEKEDNEVAHLHQAVRDKLFHEISGGPSPAEH